MGRGYGLGMVGEGGGVVFLDGDRVGSGLDGPT